MASFDQGGFHSGNGGGQYGRDLRQLGGSGDSIPDMHQHRVLMFVGLTPQRQRRGGRVQGPQEGVSASAVAAFAELGAKGSTVRRLAGLSGFTQAEDPVGSTPAATAAVL
ncbi:hypothetical protein [Prosthecobacter dejongeii]|uniref:Uncharacterized protein n=1 Tax=Prosthecobacter dejongeii TaxID=48465 RepID=A0A7W7YQC8_9BACT|nr:hypothetical protein [Prosthecobacter dejongeii]MBB5040282.1 hypothetical protein [Prosthecobacter dejongeii]